MLKYIAIITGATGGIGKEFTAEMNREQIDEIWAIGRNEQRLTKLREQFGEKIVPINIDLTSDSGLQKIKEMLNENISVSWLINNAGTAQMKLSKDFTAEEIERTVKLNCTVPAVLINYCIPYMKLGSRIINVSSASAFQPVPYINLYAATKAFEHSYSRAVNAELKQLGITVTAASPGWVDTDLLNREMNGHKVKFPGIVSAERVAKKAIMDAKKGKDVSICSFYVKCQHISVKLLPHKFVIKLWLSGIRKYI